MTPDARPQRREPRRNTGEDVAASCYGFVLWIDACRSGDKSQVRQLYEALEMMAAIAELRIVSRNAASVLVCERSMALRTGASVKLLQARRNFLLIWLLNQSSVSAAQVSAVFNALDPTAEPTQPPLHDWYRSCAPGAAQAWQRIGWRHRGPGAMLLGLERACEEP